MVLWTTADEKEDLKVSQQRSLTESLCLKQCSDVMKQYFVEWLVLLSVKTSTLQIHMWRSCSNSLFHYYNSLFNSLTILILLVLTAQLLTIYSMYTSTLYFVPSEQRLFVPFLRSSQGVQDIYCYFLFFWYKRHLRNNPRRPLWSVELPFFLIFIQFY